MSEKKSNLTRVTIKRVAFGNYGTFGILTVSRGESSFRCVTGELPWKENRKNLSCVPAGLYRAEMRASTKGWRYELKNVPKRTAILLHPGNFCGDVEKGQKTDTQGCILLGLGMGRMEGQEVVLSSVDAVKAFEGFVGGGPIEVEIVEG